MTTTIAFAQESWDTLRDALDNDVETGWVLLTRRLGGFDGDTTLLVREILPVPDAAYTVRAKNRLTISPSGWLPAFARADRDDCVPLFVHTHPGGRPEHSELDDRLDSELARVADIRLKAGMYGSLVLGGTPRSPTFAARLTHRGSEWRTVDRVRVVGQRLTLLANCDAPPLPLFDRQIRAFGVEGQQLLAELRVGVVGAGGTGSAAVEQLVRLGVKHVVLIDPQTLSNTNVTRVYGSSLDDVGRPKVDIAADNARATGFDATIVPIVGSILEEPTIKALMHCDAVLGCTDDHAGRLVLTRLPQFLLQLLIDCGVVLDSRAGSLFDIFARVTVVSPTSACLLCTGDVDPEKARLQLMTEDERAALIREGYAPELGDPDPSVITFTTIAASLAVNELLSRLLGYSEEDPANRLVARIGSRDTSRTRHTTRGNHRCGKQSLVASGEREPFLDYGWSHG